MLRQLTDDFKEENTEKESVQCHILLNNNLLFIYEQGSIGGGH